MTNDDACRISRALRGLEKSAKICQSEVYVATYHAVNVTNFVRTNFAKERHEDKLLAYVIKPFAFDVFDPRAVVTSIASSCKNDIHAPWDSPWCAFLWWRTLVRTIELYVGLFFHARETSILHDGVIERFLCARYRYVYFGILD